MLEKTVSGPIASLSCTTKDEIYEDNMSLCFLIAVDESKEQTQKIIEYQNWKVSGKIDAEEEKRLTNLPAKLCPDIKALPGREPLCR